MKHAQRTEKYIRLIFNSYISDGDFLKSPCALQTRTSFFLEIFKAKRGCALCTNAHYSTLNTVCGLLSRKCYYFLDNYAKVIPCTQILFLILWNFMIVPQIERQAPIFEQYQIINQLKKVSVKKVFQKNLFQCSDLDKKISLNLKTLWHSIQMFVLS